MGPMASDERNIVPEQANRGPKGDKRQLHKALTWCASLGLLGGVSSLTVGLICVGLHAALAPERVFDRTATILLIAAIPLILAGSAFFDEMEKQR